MSETKLYREWKRAPTNPALRKYTKETMLQKFSDDVPKFELTDELNKVFSSQTLKPLLTTTHPLPSVSNSRKLQKKQKQKVPEWHFEGAGLATPEISIEPGVKNLPLSALKEDFSKIDELFEKKIKEENSEKEEELPQWDDPSGPTEFIPIVRYPSELVYSYLEKGSPFAAEISDYSELDTYGGLTPLPYSKPFQKHWFYKDPHKNTQGPFCSIEMFNWSVGGYFPENLQLALNNCNSFLPLYVVMMETRVKRTLRTP